MSLSDEQWAFLKDVAKLIDHADSIGYKLTGGELWRTKEQQAIYVETGLSKTENSKHLDRLAIDLNLFINNMCRTDKEAFRPLASYWRALSEKNVSGYDWNWDFGHFERRV
jgi:peptidoglycan L-alanyl-D-glutamate endopeptidase CwlK